MIENDLYHVKEYKFENPFFGEIDSIKDNCFRDCHHKYFQKLKYESIYDVKLINVTNN